MSTVLEFLPKLLLPSWLCHSMILWPTPSLGGFFLLHWVLLKSLISASLHLKIHTCGSQPPRWPSMVLTSWYSCPPHADRDDLWNQ